ncbi:ABC transporter ATP-binding protein [Eubacteriales bacterium OttesenSCG-928-A19]|nr:ABC transporter ATP-binding protein [Eubacteriales bacterium OttesenSCG-928-A19]
MQERILTVEDLKTYYYSKNKVVPAVDGVSFSLAPGEFLGIVGESGCGKSTVVRSLIKLIDPAYTRIESGQVLFEGTDILQLSPEALCKVRGKEISMIFQNPLSSLNPVFTVGTQLMEALTTHERLSKREAHSRAVQLLHLVKIPSPEMRMNDYPHQLSGGMQQRVLIAIALACNPQIVIADEPTTALDVTIQAQILDLIRELRKEVGMAMLLITHNMGVVAETCERMMVMYGGVVVEEGMTETIFGAPCHPYTRGLLAAIPSIEEDKDELYSIPGQVPVFSHPVTQCRFCSRCAWALPRCAEEEPPLETISGAHRIRCWRREEIVAGTLYRKEGGMDGE